jgi:periplasmic protein TonB
MANGTMPMPGAQFPTTANDRLKNSFNDWFWGSLAAAAVIHFLIIAFFPDMQAQDVAIRSTEIQQVEVMQEFEIPPPPEQIQRPSIPILSTDVNISEDITIGEVTFNENPVSDLPPPPTGSGVDVSDNPTFTPYEVKPELRNRAEFGRLIERRYPPMLRDAGIGGTVVLWVFIDESGTVRNTRVTQSSGYDQLDEAARAAMSEARFTPALNRDQRVPVWIQLPVTFQTR